MTPIHSLNKELTWDSLCIQAYVKYVLNVSVFLLMYNFKILCKHFICNVS